MGSETRNIKRVSEGKHGAGVPHALKKAGETPAPQVIFADYEKYQTSVRSARW